MKAKRCREAILVLTVLLGTSGVFLIAGERPDAMQTRSAGLELLVNGDFDGPVKEQTPTGWFKAMRPEQTDNLRTGIEAIPQRGNVAFIEQTGVKIHLVNNWAQRVNTIPVGATVRVTADVKTRSVPANAGFIMVQFWDEAERLIGGATSQGVEPIGGTEDWKPVSFEFVVPPGTEAMILRCGLAGSGRIWFDSLSMKMIGAGASGAARGPRSGGFQVTAESLDQLERVRTFGDGLVAHAQRELGDEVRVRREVFAQGDGKFQVVLSLDLSKHE